MVSKEFFKLLIGILTMSFATTIFGVNPTHLEKLRIQSLAQNVIFLM